MYNLDLLPRSATSSVPVTSPGGVSLAVAAVDVLRSASAAARFRRQLFDLVVRNYRVSLKVDGLGKGSTAAARFASFCALLGRDCAQAGLDPSAVEICVCTSALAPGAAARVCRHELGSNVLNIIVDDDALLLERSALALWRLRVDRNVRVAFWPIAASGCPLLSAEAATAVLPATGLQVPERSAWVVAELDLALTLRHAGNAWRPAIAEQVRAIVEAADGLHEKINWPTPAMTQDSWLNRRIAIRIEGIGQAIFERGLDPAYNETRRVVTVWIDSLRAAAQDASASIAASVETLPAIAAASPCRGIRRASARKAWERRWLHAVRRAAVRHRNLLALSPWSFFPNGTADPAYAELLPLLSLADVCGFRRQHSIEGWNINEFRRFHERAAAVLTAARQDCVVAERL